MSALLGRGTGGGGGPVYSDGVTLLTGCAAPPVRPPRRRGRGLRRGGAGGRYACIMVGVLDVVVVSLVAGRRLDNTLLARDSPLMRHLLSLVRYAFLLSKVRPNPRPFKVP